MPSDTRPPREVELKLAIPDGSGGIIARLLQDRAAGGGQQRHEVTTYFDTANQALAAAGVSLRIRDDGRRHIQTVKAVRQLAVAADRAEWEWPVLGEQPDTALIRETPVASLFPGEGTWQPAFRTEIDRTIWLLDLNGAMVEAALDEGRIVAGDTACSVQELELELRQGDPAPLYRLALHLHTTVPLRIEPESKAMRGWRPKNRTLPQPVKGDDYVVSPDIPAGQALRKIVAAELGHLLANRPAALLGNADGLHQMRVAVRRLRAVLTLFAPHLEPHASAAFQHELRRIGRVYGEARDWDVFCPLCRPQGTLVNPDSPCPPP